MHVCAQNVCTCVIDIPPAVFSCFHLYSVCLSRSRKKTSHFNGRLNWVKFFNICFFLKNLELMPSLMFKYRLYPSKTQIKILEEHLERCRKPTTFRSTTASSNTTRMGRHRHNLTWIITSSPSKASDRSSQGYTLRFSRTSRRGSRTATIISMQGEERGWKGGFPDSRSMADTRA